ncbi:DUF2207 domain-containing protein [Ruminococcaceae bacterium OttesenSCG-928-I18]|nr:DUF2207 domain-containing protein [Ruminococcaceae bacterium OttesenSCG-928-I18]
MTRKRLVTFGVIVLVVLLAGAFSVGFFRLDFSFGAQQVYNSLNVDAELMENGSLRVTEHWQMQYQKRDTPYWNHSIFINKANASSVQDFAVYDTDYGRDYEFKTDVTAFNAGERACYIIDNNQWYELGWNFPPIDSGERNFSISYTLTDAVSNYADADELRYAFVPESNPFPVRRFSLTLRFPNTGSAEAVHAWMHCEEGGVWTLEESRILRAEVNNLPARCMLEMRVLLPPDSIEGAGFLSDTSVLDEALAEESAYSNGGQGSSLSRYRHFSVLLSILGAVAAILAVLFLLLRGEKRAKAGLEAPAPLLREMPSCVRPAIVNRLYYYENDEGSADSGESFALSATTLSLVHKRWLRLHPAETEEALRIELVRGGRSPAEGEERVLAELFRTVADAHEGSFTLAQLREYAKEHPGPFAKHLSAYNEAVKRKFTRLGWVRPLRFFNTMAGWACLIALVLALVVLVLGGFVGKWILFAGLLVAAALAGFYAAFRLRLTEKGLAELMRWRGFSKYLREYSLLCKKPREELSLWGDYLVYAAALGIAKTALAEMSLLYTRLAEETPAAARGDVLPSFPLENPIDAYFGTAEGEMVFEKELWVHSAFVGEIARVFRELKAGKDGTGTNRQGGSDSRINRALAKLGRRFGTK